MPSTVKAAKSYKEKVKKSEPKSIKVRSVEIGVEHFLDGLEGVVSLPIRNANGHNLIEGLMRSAKPEEIFREVLADKIGGLMVNLNEVRTERSVIDLTLKAEIKRDFDDRWVELTLHAIVDPDKEPDLPALTGQMAKAALERIFGGFPVHVEIEGDNVDFLQQQPIWIKSPEGESPLRSPLPTIDVQQLYVSAAHNICAAILERSVSHIRFGDEQGQEWVSTLDWLEMLAEVEREFSKTKTKKKSGTKRVK